MSKDPLLVEELAKRVASVKNAATMIEFELRYTAADVAVVACIEAACLILKQVARDASNTKSNVEALDDVALVIKSIREAEAQAKEEGSG